MWVTFKKNTVDNQENSHSEYKLPHIREIELDLIRRRPWKVHLSKNWLQHMSPCFFSHSLPTALHSIHVCCLIHLHLLTFGIILSIDIIPFITPKKWKICRLPCWPTIHWKKSDPSLNQSRPAPQTRTVYAADPTPVTGEVDETSTPWGW